MKKKPSTFLNMLITLFVITVIAGLSLGFINELTLEPKAKAKLAKKTKALQLVLPEFNNNPVREVLKIKSDLAKDSVEIYTAKFDQKIKGTAVVGSTEKGFSGLIKIMVGFKPDGGINNIVVLEQKETPGLGTKMKEEAFINQYRDKNPGTSNLKTSKDGGEIDALTGATITTRAFSDAVEMAYQVYSDNINAEKDE
ncbi:MAG: RnfABCDGE type electron transport complex subunit G [Flavobacteriaceae bacterium]|nr:RnfABCDGE type electron transport complex subunit G [Flavobacteriaceae bacterium]